MDERVNRRRRSRMARRSGRAPRATGVCGESRDAPRQSFSLPTAAAPRRIRRPDGR
ncbi:hypothetical protein BURPS305_4645 [Burkholderia pseudomallei 305]|nr:hypothetical protein BURPS305_4645 [Burkholderia pseudomallei 305]